MSSGYIFIRRLVLTSHGKIMCQHTVCFLSTRCIVQVYSESIHTYNDSVCTVEMDFVIKTLRDSYISSDRYVTSVDIGVTAQIGTKHGGASNGVAYWMGYAIRPK